MYRQITILFLLVSNLSASQSLDTIWFNNKWEKTDKLGGVYYRILRSDTLNNTYEIIDYYPNGQVQMRGTLSSINPEVRDGAFTWYYENGVKRMDCIYENNLIANTREWDTHGELKPIPISSIQVNNGDNLPEFPGGNNKINKYISKTIKYPPEAYKQDIKGDVEIGFTIDINGDVTNVYVKKGVHPLLDNEAIRVIKSMPKWKPGVQKGEKVAVQMVLSIAFNN